MEQINTLILKDPLIYPDEIVLNKVLGESFQVYQAVLALCDKYKLTCEWRYYNDGKVWLAKITSKNKTIIWMSAWTGFMKATIYFPEKYLEGVFTLDISEETKQAIRTTKNVGKSKPCTFELNTSDVLPELEKVMIYKLSLK